MASAWLATFASHDSAGTLYENTIGVKMDPVSGSGLNATDLASAVNDWLGDSYRGMLSGLLTFDSITVKSTPLPSTSQGVHAVGLAGAGQTDDDFPKELAVILSWKTDFPQRSGRGHIALAPSRTASFLSHSNWNLASTYFTVAVKAFLDALDAGHDWQSGGVTEGHLSHVVYSRKYDAYHDVKTRLIRSQVRWVERRQTAP